MPANFAQDRMKRPLPPETGYLVYLMIDPRDMVPFYAGMTCRPTSRWHAHAYPQAWTPVAERLRELRRVGLKCRVRLVAMNLSRTEAWNREAALIALHKTTLVNKMQPRLRAAD